MENAGKERSIAVLSGEGRSYPPSAAFSKTAWVPGRAARERLAAAAARSPERFWDAAARELHWFKPWRRTLWWKAPNAKWFVGGATNISYNCLD
ncbi:MAG: acetyl-coenzyme A synthetase, partial [Elusimicrobia bacterium]|nr:acetyl-coenzyme A synthetase [Elusimicrobiota bacterium]